MEIPAPVNSLKQVDKILFNVMDVEIRVVFSGDDKQVFGERARAKAQKRVGQGQYLQGFSVLVRDIAFQTDGKEQGVNTGGVNGVDGFQTGDFYRDHWTGYFVNEVAKCGVFLRGAADDGEWPDRVLSVIDCVYLHYGKVVLQAVVTEVVAKWAFGKGFAGDDSSSDAEIRFGGDDVVPFSSISESATCQSTCERDFGKPFG